MSVTNECSDVTFILPVKIDSKDRAKNLFVVIGFIKKFFNSHIIVVEQNSNMCETNILNSFKDIEYYVLDINDTYIRKCHLINKGILNSKTPIVAIQDSDVFAAPQQYMGSINMVRKSVDCSLPYNNITWQISSSDMNKVYPNFDFNIIEGLNKRNITPPSYNGPTIGGILFFNKEKLIRNGMYNQTFKGWGNEDDEIFYRFGKLGNTIERVNGDLYHIEHSRNIAHRGYAPGNREEYIRIISLTTSQLQEEVNRWMWTKGD